MHISGPEMLQRCFLVPVVPKAELAAVVRSQARQTYPFNIDNGLFGWKVIDRVDWADGPKYEIYTQALDKHWYDWLDEMFGSLVNKMTLIVSTGQQLEELLSCTSTSFSTEGSCFIRLKAHVLETGFFHNGHLEFFREAPVESVTEIGLVTGMKEIVGEPSDDDRLQWELLLNDIRISISDALDYYLGQYGQRSIETAYVCLPPELPAMGAEVVQSSIGGQVVDLCEPSRIESHCRWAGVVLDFDDYYRWMSILPKRKVGRTLVNLLPEQVNKQNREKRVFRYSLTALVVVLFTVIMLSGLKWLSINTLDTRLCQQQEFASQIQANPVLALLSDYKQQADILQKNVSNFEKKSSLELVKSLKLLSRLAREEVRLNSVICSFDPTHQIVYLNIKGVVIGPKDRQEAALFSYLADLNKHPLTSSAILTSKDVTTQFGRQNVLFTINLVIES